MQLFQSFCVVNKQPITWKLAIFCVKKKTVIVFTFVFPCGSKSQGYNSQLDSETISYPTDGEWKKGY